MLGILIGAVIAIIVSLILAILGFLLKSSVFGIIAGTIFVLSLGTCIGALIIYLTQRDDVSKAKIFRDIGLSYEVIDGVAIATSNTGITYQYGKNKTVIVPHSYGIKYIKHKRVIGVGTSDSLLPNPLGVSRIERTENYSELIKQLTLGHIGADIVKAVSSSKFQLSWIMIAIIAFIIGAVGMQVYNGMQKSGQPVQQPTAQVQPVQPAASPITIEGGE